MKETVVFEIALNTITMVRLYKAEERIVLAALEQVKLPLNERGEASPEDIVDGVRSLYRKSGSRNRFINCIVPGKHLLIKAERLPPVKGVKLSQILQYEIDNHLLVNKQELTYDYQVVDDEVGPRLLLVACRTDVVKSEIAPIERANLEINCVEFSPGALFDGFLYNYGLVDKLTALVNIGSYKTDLVIQRRGHVYFAQSIVGGYDLFIEGIRKGLNLSQEEAETTLEEEAVILADEEAQGKSRDEVSRIVTSEFAKILLKVQRYIHLWKTDTDIAEKNIEKVYLSGYGSLLPDADKYVSHFFKIDTELLNPLRRVMVASGVEHARFSPSSLGVHIGAGLRELATSAVDINLLPEEKKKEVNSRKKKGYSLVSTILMITILATPFIHAYLSRPYYSSRLRSAQEVLSKYEEYIPKVTGLARERNSVIERIAALEKLRKNNTYYLESFSSISRLFPEDIYLKDFLVRLTPENKVQGFVLGGSCRDYNEIEEILDILNSSPLFAKAKVNEIREAEDAVSPNKLNFVIDLTPAVNEEERASES